MTPRTEGSSQSVGTRAPPSRPGGTSEDPRCCRHGWGIPDERISVRKDTSFTNIYAGL